MTRILRIKKRPNKPLLTVKQAKYRFQPGFADTSKEDSRRKYRSQRGKEFELGGSTVLRSLEFIDHEAVTLPVYSDVPDVRGTFPCIRPTRLAELLNTSYQTVWRWVQETGQLPEPVLKDTTQGRERAVYHLEEAKIIVRALGEHFNQFKYYRSDHSGTRDRLFTQIQELRNRNYGEARHAHQRQTPGKEARSRRRIVRAR